MDSAINVQTARMEEPRTFKFRVCLRPRHAHPFKFKQVYCHLKKTSAHAAFMSISSVIETTSKGA